jgi:hypothetical protein
LGALRGVGATRVLPLGDGARGAVCGDPPEPRELPEVRGCPESRGWMIGRFSSSGGRLSERGDGGLLV